MFIVVCFVITVILHSVKAVICLFIQKTFTPEISLPKVREFFFFSWWSHASSITYICIVPGLCKSVGMRVILVEGQAIQEKKIDLQASIFLEYLILSKVGEIFLKAFIRVRNCVENFFFILQQKDDVHEYCIASSWKIHGYDVNVPFNDHIHQCKLFQHTSSDIW